jgi:hypothetical protein
MDPYSLSGVGSRVVGDGFSVQIVEDGGTEPEVWKILRFDLPATSEEVVEAMIS